MLSSRLIWCCILFLGLILIARAKVQDVSTCQEYHAWVMCPEDYGLGCKCGRNGGWSCPTSYPACIKAVVGYLERCFESNMAFSCYLNGTSWGCPEGYPVCGSSVGMCSPDIDPPAESCACTGCESGINPCADVPGCASCEICCQAYSHSGICSGFQCQQAPSSVGAPTVVGTQPCK